MEKIILEKVSEQVHNLWMGWAKELISSENLSNKRIKRWTKCFVSYNKLSNRMKIIDRKFAKQLIKITKEK
jgi:hypothetical protein